MDEEKSTKQFHFGCRAKPLGWPEMEERNDFFFYNLVKGYQKKTNTTPTTEGVGGPFAPVPDYGQSIFFEDGKWWLRLAEVGLSVVFCPFCGKKLPVEEAGDGHG